MQKHNGSKANLEKFVSMSENNGNCKYVPWRSKINELFIRPGNLEE